MLQRNRTGSSLKHERDAAGQQGTPFMADTQEPITIKKYANRRLYNTGTSSYVTLDDLAEMVKKNEVFVVVDAKTSEDITRSVLTQIIVEQESRGGNMLPISFLRQLIGFYGDSMQSLVPSYLDFSMQSLTKEQGRFREEMTQTIGQTIGQTVGSTAMTAMEDQVKRNMEMYERAFRMFSPFAPNDADGDTQSGTEAKSGETTKPAQAKPKSRRATSQAAAGAASAPADDIDSLRDEVARMQDKLNRLTKS
jgi:polyhydroxyalkanoate synthesis repressor PhaR